MSTNHRRLAALLIAVGLGSSIAACGGDDSGNGDGDVVISSGEASDEASNGENADGEADADSDAGAAPSFAPVTVEGDPLAPLEDPGDDPAVGSTAPSLAGTDYTGESVTFTPGERATLLVFLAHWCPHCNAEIPMMIEWQEAGHEPDDVDILGVSTAVDPRYPNYPPGEWITDTQWPWPVIADDQSFSAANAFGISGFPFMVLVDADGNVVARTSGEKTSDQLNSLLGELA